MKYFFLVFLLAAYPVYSVEFPKEINGIALDTHIDEYEKILKTETALPIRFMEYLTEVEIQRGSGFKSGYLAYGNCSSEGKITRIKLKYENSSREFFETLLEKFKSRFGNPDEWQGDSFHIVLAWKWIFTDGDRNTELYLQHNTMDTGRKLGNSVKIVDTSLIAKEQKCFQEKFPDFRKSGGKQSKDYNDNWENLLPK